MRLAVHILADWTILAKFIWKAENLAEVCLTLTVEWLWLLHVYSHLLLSKFLMLKNHLHYRNFFSYFACLYHITFAWITTCLRIFSVFFRQVPTVEFVLCIGCVMTWNRTSRAHSGLQGLQKSLRGCKRPLGTTRGPKRLSVSDRLCVRLSRLLVGFRMHYKSLHFHSFK